MEYRSFGKIDFKPSALGFGCMRLRCEDGTGMSRNVDEKESVRMMRYAMDHGVNYLDTAYTYHGGNSEIVLGKAIKDGYRQKIKLADKSPVFLIKKETDFDEMLDKQLKRLGTDFIDFYLMHSISYHTFEKHVLEFDLIGKAERAKKAGKIGHIGFSFHDDYQAFEKILNAYDGWEFCQIQLNYLDTENQAGLKGLRAAAAKGLGVVVMEPLLGGKLASPPKRVLDIFDKSEVKRTPVEWALDFLWDMPEVSIVLSGMNTMKQTEENVAYAQKAKPGMLSDKDQALIKEVVMRFNSLVSIPCTGCSYCMPCPNGVNIPENFGVYNDFFMYDDPAVARAAFHQMKSWQGAKASAASCVGCGVCEEKCPQKIPISEIMPKAAELFAKNQIK